MEKLRISRKIGLTLYTKRNLTACTLFFKSYESWSLDEVATLELNNQVVRDVLLARTWAIRALLYLLISPKSAISKRSYMKYTISIIIFYSRLYINTVILITVTYMLFLAGDSIFSYKSIFLGIWINIIQSTLWRSLSYSESAGQANYTSCNGKSLSQWRSSGVVVSHLSRLPRHFSDFLFIVAF